MSSNYTKNIQVFARIKTNPDFNMDYVKILSDKKTVCVRSTQDFSKKILSNTPHYWIFQTNGIFLNDSQDYIYETVTKDVLTNILNGVNVVIIGYGQTGTGKSTTMHGFQGSYRNRGLSLRVIEDLLEFQNNLKQKSSIELEASCIEVHKQHLRDLLSDSRKKCYRPYNTVLRLPIRSIDDGYMYSFFSEMNKTTYNNGIYLSHKAPSVFTIFVKNLSLIQSDPVDKFGKIHIIDLSGADSIGNDSCLHKTDREVGESNLMKTHLEQLLLIFTKYGKFNEKLRGMGCLVEYLSDSLKPSNILRFIAHISTEKENLPITISHLRFNQLATLVVPAKKISCTKNSEQVEKVNLQTWLSYYVEQDILKSMLFDEDRPQRLTPERMDQIQGAVDEFINSKMDNITLLTVSDATTVLNLVRDMYRNKEMELLKFVQDKADSFTSKSDIIIASKTSKVSQCTLLKSKSEQSKTRRSKTKSKEKSSIRLSKSPSKRYSKTDNKMGASKTTIRKSVTTNRSQTYSEKNGQKSRRSTISKLNKKEKSKISTSKTNTSQKSNRSSYDDPELMNYLKTHLNNYEEVWKEFCNENAYKDLNHNLKKTAKDYVTSLKQYNDVIAKMQHCNQFLDGKKDYLFKVQVYKNSRQFDCSFEEEEKLLELNNNLRTAIDSLKNEICDLKEQLLTKQAELKINMDDYHRIKKEIGEMFIKHCKDKYNIFLGNGEQHIEDDKLLAEKIDSIEHIILDDKFKSNEATFNYYQHEMNKLINENEQNK